MYYMSEFVNRAVSDLAQVGPCQIPRHHIDIGVSDGKLSA
jgi:hypothetical protein